ncbi:MAG: O-methyltransferase [Candidatus Hodarchaeota archaeon]
MRPFDQFPIDVQKTLLALEEQDQKERINGHDISIRLRQIPRETGEFLYLFISSLVNKQTFLGLEIGFSGGYSTIWQGIALKMKKMGQLYSLDHDPKKFHLASRNIALTELIDYVKLFNVDAKSYIMKFNEKFDYVFLDAEKEEYLEFYNLLRNKTHSGTVLVADNVISNEEDVKDFLTAIHNDDQVTSIINPVGKGLAIVRWV